MSAVEDYIKAGGRWPPKVTRHSDAARLAVVEAAKNQGKLFTSWRDGADPDGEAAFQEFLRARLHLDTAVADWSESRPSRRGSRGDRLPDDHHRLPRLGVSGGSGVGDLRH